MAEEATTDTTNTDTTATPENTETTNEDVSLLSKEQENKEAQTDKVDGKADAETKGAPDEYEDFTLPEDTEVDPAIMDEFKVLAKDSNLPQEVAQQFVDFYNEKMSSILEQQSNAWSDTISKWADDAKADKEFGGTDFEANLSVAKVFLDKFGTPELVSALEYTGLGNHPAMIRLAWTAGKALVEDTVAHGQGVNESSQTQATRLFPNMNK